MIPFQWQGRLCIGGNIIWIHFESLPQPAENGDVLWTGIFYDITESKKREEEKNKLIESLQHALAEIKTLRGILPLCSFCKKIRDDKGYWEQVDVYIHKYSEADISHGICPECMKINYPDEHEMVYSDKNIE